MKSGITIIHFQPLELFPPVMNLITFLSENMTNTTICVVTTEENSGLEEYSCPNVKIKRFKGIDPKKNKITKLTRYFSFYLKSYKVLTKQKPTSVLYFETLSALSCIIYCKLNKKTNLLAHYHEFVSVEELENGRQLNKWINKLESANYHNFQWISQTNQHRVDLFSSQYNLEQSKTNFQVLPNYPSKNWISNKTVQPNSGNLRLVHIGALSFEGMHLRRFLQFIEKSKGIHIDFYSHSTNKQIITEIEDNENCSFCGGINYSEIPNLYGKYDAGMVLYNATSPNVIYCAPNKIFEYLALDLDVICSEELITAREYARTNVYPKIIMLDYDNLNILDLPALLDHTDLEYKASPYNCENIYSKLLIQLNENTNTKS